MVIQTLNKLFVHTEYWHLFLVGPRTPGTVLPFSRDPLPTMPQSNNTDRILTCEPRRKPWHRKMQSLADEQRIVEGRLRRQRAEKETWWAINASSPHSKRGSAEVAVRIQGWRRSERQYCNRGKYREIEGKAIKCSNARGILAYNSADVLLFSRHVDIGQVREDCKLQHTPKCDQGRTPLTDSSPPSGINTLHKLNCTSEYFCDAFSCLNEPYSRLNLPAMNSACLLG